MFNGRHCLVNEAGIEGTGLEGLCHVAGSAADFKKKIAGLFQQEFTEAQLLQRKESLEHLYNNEKNARQLIAWIY